MLGSLYYCVSLTVIMVGLSLLAVDLLRLMVHVLAGAIGFVWFVRHQLRIPNPLFKLELFKNNRTFTLSNLLLP